MTPRPRNRGGGRSGEAEAAAAALERTALMVPLESVRPFKGNPRRGNVEVIRESLRANGQYRPIVVRVKTQEVLAGNHTWLAARDEGWSEIWATFVDCDARTAKRIVAVDNRSNDVAGYDVEALVELLSSLPSLEGTGFDAQAFEALVNEVADLSAQGTDTQPIDPPKKATSRPGDIYVLGAHRLICGDSTDPLVLERLLEGERTVQLIFTDPPYGMSYRTPKLGGIEGDDKRGGELVQLVRDALKLAASWRAPGAGTYVWCTWRTFGEFVEAVRGAGLEPSACIVWSKGRMGLGSAHYRPQHEFCLYCHPEEPGDHELCLYCSGDTWEGGRGESDVWEVPRDTGYVHPTQKPIVLPERALANSTRAGALVLDVFGGSGSTLIACQNMARRARLVELDPRYCDVIVDRWERHTGEKAELIRDTDQGTDKRALQASEGEPAAAAA